MKAVFRTALLAALLGSACGLAAADAIDAPVTRTVSFADLDLTRDAGVAALYARIRAAARDVCGEPDSRELHAFMSSRHCAEEAIGRALHDANAPARSDYHLVQR